MYLEDFPFLLKIAVDSGTILNRKMYVYAGRIIQTIEKNDRSFDLVLNSRSNSFTKEGYGIIKTDSMGALPSVIGYAPDNSLWNQNRISMVHPYADNSKLLVGSSNSNSNPNNPMDTYPSGYGMLYCDNHCTQNPDSFAMCTYDGFLVKVNEQGYVQWFKSYGSSSDDKILKLLPDPRNPAEFYLLGSYTEYQGPNSQVDAWVLKIDTAGNQVWSQTFGGSDYDQFNDGYIDAQGNLIVVGSTMSNNGNVSGNNGSIDVWMAKLRDLRVSTNEPTQTPFEIQKTGETTYQITTTKPTTLTLTDALGRQLRTIKMDANTTTIDLTNYAQGVYLLAAQGYKSVKLVR
jgi:hypothetical protein